MKSYVAKSEDRVGNWHHVDAADKTLGRLASRIARVLMGKNKPTYTPGQDTGDFVVVTNCEKIAVTGRKREQKVYRYHTNFIGGLVEIDFARMIARHPDRVLRLAVQRMLPKTHLGRKQLSKLKIYAGEAHPHAAQRPQPLSL